MFVSFSFWKKCEGVSTMSLELDQAKTALVVIDMTKGVLSLASGPYPVQEVLANTVRLAEAFRRAGSFVVLVNVNSVDGKDLLHPITDAEVRMPVQRPKEWADIVPELGPRPLDHLVTKHQWGAFFGTDLDLQLRRRGIETIVLCGIATNFGVETTAREAYQHGYNQVFAEDAMNALSGEEHQHTCTYIFPRIGRIRSTDEIVATISGG
jgi:nicotinamidase-related amidase